MKLGPYLHRIGNDIVAVYLVDTAEGITLIDAGLAGHWRDLSAELPAMGRSLGDIRGVDPHPRRHRPHRLRRAAAPRPRRPGLRARGRRRPRARRGQAQARVGHDASSAPTAGFFWYAMRKGGLRTTYLTEVVDGARRRGARPARRARGSSACPATPPAASPSTCRSPTRCSSATRLTTRHVLTGRRGPQPAPFTDDPEQALASLARWRGSTRPGCCPATARPGTAASPRRCAGPGRGPGHG